MATITIPRTPATATYAAADTLIADNPDRWFVIEIDSGVFSASEPVARAEFDDLAPGESFTILAVCDTSLECERFLIALAMQRGITNTGITRRNRRATTYGAPVRDNTIFGVGIVIEGTARHTVVCYYRRRFQQHGVYTGLRSGLRAWAGLA